MSSPPVRGSGLYLASARSSRPHKLASFQAIRRITSTPAIQIARFGSICCGLLTAIRDRAKIRGVRTIRFPTVSSDRSYHGRTTNRALGQRAAGTMAGDNAGQIRQGRGVLRGRTCCVSGTNRLGEPAVAPCFRLIIVRPKELSMKYDRPKNPVRLTKPQRCALLREYSDFYNESRRN